MQNIKKIKIILGITYLCLVFTFLMIFFMNFSLNEITNYEFIKKNSQFILNLKNSNLIISVLLSFIIIVIWVLLLGFGSPVCLLGGYIFGKWIGTIIVVFSLTVGATMLYIIANFFFQDLVKEKFANRFKFLEEKIKTNEFFVIFIVRIIGGTPIQLQNIIPVLFNIKLKNFFFASLLGFVPQVYIFSALGSGLEKQIEKNIETPSFLQMITSFEIYAPILGFFILLLLAFFLRKVFFKN